MGWIVILTNNTGGVFTITDLGLSLSAAETRTVTDTFTYAQLSNSDNLKTAVTAAQVTVNDGTDTLTAAQGTNYLFGENIYHTSTTYQTTAALSGYMENVRDDVTPQLGGTLDGLNNIVDDIQMQSYSEVFSTPTISAGTLELDLEVSTIFHVELTANVTTLTITNAPTGEVKHIVLKLTQDSTGSRTVDWSSVPVLFNGGTAPTVTVAASAVDFFTLYSDGSTIYGFTAGQNMS